MQLHKAFSSLINYPKIKRREKIYNAFKDEKDFFNTINTPDDIFFAKDINDKIEKKILLRKMNNLKLLKRKNKNDIYSPNWTSNKNILRNHKKDLNIKPNDIDIIYNRNDYKNIFRNQTRNIFNSYITARNYKNMSNLKSKYLKLTINTERLTSNSKKLNFDNYMTDLLQKERKKINIKTKEFQKSLTKENHILNKDIKKFEVFQVNQDFKYQKSDNEIQKIVKNTALVYETLKMNIHYRHKILNKIQRIIKEILRLEEIVLYIYKILGYDEETTNYKQLTEIKIMLSATNQNDIMKNVRKIFFQSNIIFNQLFKDVESELDLDEEKIFYALNNKEKMILKKVNEREDIIRSITDMETEFEKEMIKDKKKYDNYLSEYLVILKNYEEELDKYNISEKNSKSSIEFINNINYLSEIKALLFNQKSKKINLFYDNLIYGNIIIPCLEKLKQKEFFVDDIIKRMEKYEIKDPEIFNKCTSNCKYINKMEKIENERKIVEEKEFKQKLKLFLKHQKFILKNKYKYNLPIQKRVKKTFSDSKKQK